MSPSAEEVRGAVRDLWSVEVGSARYLPVGFGAHHWQVNGLDEVPALFATVDILTGHRTAEHLRASYRAATALASIGFTGVVAPVPTCDGEVAVSVGDGVLLSVTPWLSGRSPGEEEAREPGHVARVARLLGELHGLALPADAPEWSPRVHPGFAARIGTALEVDWTAGPFGAAAHREVTRARSALAGWETRYLELCAKALACRENWVPTHGEPHFANQFIDASGLRLVDWETLAVAPPERDLRDLPEPGRSRFPVDPEMIELFDLEWRLMEVDEYVRWFQGPHEGTSDDETALAGLREEIRHGLNA